MKGWLFVVFSEMVRWRNCNEKNATKELPKATLHSSTQHIISGASNRAAYNASPPVRPVLPANRAHPPRLFSIRHSAQPITSSTSRNLSLHGLEHTKQRTAHHRTYGTSSYLWRITVPTAHVTHRSRAQLPALTTRRARSSSTSHTPSMPSAHSISL